MPDASADYEKTDQAREETRAGERYIKPAVDIIETEYGLTMVADIPGTAKETVDVNVDKGILTINAPVSRSMLLSSVFDIGNFGSCRGQRRF